MRVYQHQYPRSSAIFKIYLPADLMAISSDETVDNFSDICVPDFLRSSKPFDDFLAEPAVISTSSLIKFFMESVEEEASPAFPLSWSYVGD